MKRVTLTLRGKVQAVGYRDYVRKKASMENITGYVKNNRDGSVTVVGEAKESVLRDFVKYCKKGPLLAFIEDMNEEWSEATADFESFLIEY